MLSFVTSQAMALSQVKHDPNNSSARQQKVARRTGKGFWSRLFEAMVDARMRRAAIELRYHRGLHEERANK
jgi:hypothetical protein